MWQFVGSLVVSIIVAVLTVQLSLRRFYREKWWERRLDAYTRIVEALHHMQQDLELSYRHETEGGDSESAHAQELSVKAKAGWAEIRKARDMGELLLSEAALDALKHLLEDRPRPDTYFEYIDATLAEVHECLPKFIALAKNDLRLSPSKIEKVWRRRHPESAEGKRP